METNRKQKNEIKSMYSFSWKKLWTFMSVVGVTAKQHPILFSLMIIATTADAIIATLLPVAASNITKLLTNVAQGTGSETNSFLGLTMHWQSWIYVCVAIFGILLVVEYITDYAIGIFAVRTEVIQRNLILKSLVEQDVDFFFDNVSGNIMTRLVGDTSGLSLGIQQFLTNVIYAGAMFTTAVVVIFINGYDLVGGIALGYIIAVVAIATVIFIYYRKSMIRMFDVKREIDADMTDRIQNITLIKSSGKEEYELNRTDEQLTYYNNKGNTVVKWSASLNLWVTVTISFSTTLITIVMAAMAINNSDPRLIVDLTLALPMVSYMGLPIVMLTPTLRAAARASNCAQRIGDLTNPVPHIKPNEDGPVVEKITSIVFKDMEFAYPKKIDKIIIPATSFTFEPGKSYAFVGETGSGKSTIGRLLLRYYEPIKGQILINGTDDLHDINLPKYLDRVGYVEQDPQILYGNFLENIRYGRFDATKEQVIEAAKKAELHDFIMSLPEGYETILGQRGFLLSGGQKQRLVIARVFLKNPDLIILDEATSALDNIVEKEIQAKLDELIKGKTSITIAHRLSTIKNVDQIIVLGMGQGIVQQGTFDELIKKPGHFKDLYEAGKN